MVETLVTKIQKLTVFALVGLSDHFKSGQQLSENTGWLVGTSILVISGLLFLLYPLRNLQNTDDTPSADELGEI